MKLRTKAILFFGLFLLSVVLATLFYSQYIVGNVFKEQAKNSLQIFAEVAEGSYYTFLKSTKARAVDWSADPALQDIVGDLLETNAGTTERARLAKDFARYMEVRKMPYDQTVFIAEILDKNGIVIASTKPLRIGTDERKEEIEHKVSYFTKTITANFGEAFVKSIVFEEDESPKPMVHVTTRVFSQKNNVFTPLDAVLMLHFLNIDQIADVLSGEWQVKEGAQTGKALLTTYKTSEIYLVNSEHIMVTPTRHIQDTAVKQKVNTPPVAECLNNNKEVVLEYDNYRGERVLGASMCLESQGLVLLVEVNKDEILTPFAVLGLRTVVGIGALLIFGIFIIISFIRTPLQRIDDVIDALERMMRNDFTKKIVVQSNDETGRLATMFNTMLDVVQGSRKDLERSNRMIEEKVHMLEKDLDEHQKQEKFLEESKKATLNLLEDSWKAKEKLEEEGKKLQTIISSIEDGLVIIDRNYIIFLVNPKAMELFRMPANELLGKDLREIVKLYKKRNYIETSAWPIEEVFMTNKSITSIAEDNFSITTKGRETELPIGFSVSALDGSFAGVVIIIRDVTADRELDEAKSGFISVASHQLRTPLTSIRWYSEMLLAEDTGPLNESQKDFMREIHGGAERLYQTVDLLLGISRVESGKMKSEKIAINLGEFTEGITKELRSQMNVKNLVLSVVPPPGDGVIVTLDPITLRQVVLNLVSNAIRYTNAQGFVEIKWWWGDDGKEIIYMVHDNGIGIPDSEHSHMFSKFFRAENARAQVPDGSGLGLALVKDLVESWGGKIWYDSREGSHTTFFFTIPR